MEKAALTEHQKLILQGGIPTTDRGRLAAFIESYRGGVSRSKWPTADRMISLVDQKGEGRLDDLGIPPENREGAALEMYVGGPSWSGAYWQSFGLAAKWGRGPTHWILESVERLELGGGPDTARLATTAEQDALIADHNSRSAYAIRAKFSGDSDNGR